MKITNTKDHLCSLIRKNKSPPKDYCCKLILHFENILLPVQKAAWQHVHSTPRWLRVLTLTKS